MDKLTYIRKLQTKISIILFIIIFLFSWHTTEFSILDIQLSQWGVELTTAKWWNFIIMLLSITLSINTLFYIIKHNRIIYKQLFICCFLILFISLFITGLLPMNYEFHDITAYFYFLTFPFIIFLLAFLNRKKIQYREWLNHLIFSTCMIIIPLIFINIFKGMAIAEVSHSIIVMGWSLWLLKENK